MPNPRSCRSRPGLAVLAGLGLDAPSSGFSRSPRSGAGSARCSSCSISSPGPFWAGRHGLGSPDSSTGAPWRTIPRLRNCAHVSNRFFDELYSSASLHDGRRGRLGRSLAGAGLNRGVSGGGPCRTEAGPDRESSDLCLAGVADWPRGGARPEIPPPCQRPLPNGSVPVTLTVRVCRAIGRRDGHRSGVTGVAVLVPPTAVLGIPPGQAGIGGPSGWVESLGLLSRGCGGEPGLI
jgi:hypothetical protein